MTGAERRRYAWAAGLVAGRRVLELGCGEGEGTELLAGRARAVHAVDPDPGAVRRAERRLGDRPGVTFAVADPAAALAAPSALGVDAVVDLRAGAARPAPGALAAAADAGVVVVALDPQGEVPGGRRFAEVEAEGGWILGEGDRPAAVALAAQAGAGDDAEPAAGLVVRGLPGAAPAGAVRPASPEAALAAERLAAENRVLHRVNGELAAQVRDVLAELGAGAAPVALLRRADSAATGRLAAMEAAAARTADLEDRLERTEERVLALDERARRAEARVAELDAALAAQRARAAALEAVRARKAVRLALGVSALRTLPARVRRLRPR